MGEFNELIKDIDRVRDYIREFFIFGWRSRSEYKQFIPKSDKTYDNEKRRAESWFGGKYGQKNTAEDGRVIFSISLSGDTRYDRNPLYEIWKTKTFTKKDLSLHFIILDLLSRYPDAEATAEWITEKISMPDNYGLYFDLGTVRSKLDEYCKNGILEKRSAGKKNLYSLYGTTWKNIANESENVMEAISFFTETAHLGVIGSHIQDEALYRNESFIFSDDFVANTLDDEVIGDLLDAIRERREVTINTKRNDGSNWTIGSECAIPIKILSSVENGRRYVAMKKGSELIFRELEIIHSVEPGDISPDFYKYREELDKYLMRCWDIDFKHDVDTESLKKTEHVQVKLSIDAQREMRVLRRLMNEGRNGKVLVEVPNIYVYKNELWNALEILPFVMSFAGYILSFKSDNEEAVRIFSDNIEKMRLMYECSN